MTGATRSGIPVAFFFSRDGITMASNNDHVSDGASDFEDSGDEDSFYGFYVGGNNSNDESDLDFSDLVSDEDQEEAEGDAQQEVSDEEDPDELRWSDQLLDFPIPDFVEASGIRFQPPDNPTVH